MHSSRRLEQVSTSTGGRETARETTAAILHTADVLRRRLASLIEPHGITAQQYNVLRILRQAEGGPLPTLAIADRLIEHTPGITRLLDRLEAKGLVRRERCPDDRRLVHCWITEQGHEVLHRMDPTVEEVEAWLLSELSDADMRQLVALLDRVRSGG